MINFTYAMQETFSGLGKAKISVFFSVLIVSFLLILTGLLGLFSINVDRLLGFLNAEYDIQVFISDILDDNEIATLGAHILNMDHVEKVDFYSKEVAARDFSSEFGTDLFDVLQENPLPSSFRISIVEKERDSARIEQIARDIEKENGVDEVVYQSSFIETLSTYSSYSKVINYILLVFVVSGSILVVSNTVRLVIMARKSIIETMQLVGATTWFVRTPLLIEGLIQGFLGGVLAAITLYLLVFIINTQSPDLLLIKETFLLQVIGLGVLLGFSASTLAIWRYLPK